MVQERYFCDNNLRYLQRLFLLVFAVLVWQSAVAQSDTLIQPNRDTQAQPKSIPPPRTPRAIPRSDTTRFSIDTTTINRSDSTDSINAADSLIQLQQDSIAKKDTVPPKIYQGMDSAYVRFLRHPFLPTTTAPVYQIAKLRQVEGKDDLFYLLSGLVFFLAFIKLFFSRYFSNIFRLFFQPSFRQKQTREQLMQSSLPSFLLNVFFLLSAGVYCALLFQHYNLAPVGFWLLFLYSTLGLLILYLSKFVLLSFSGWVFNVREASATYIFVVNLINKIMGVLLLPFIFVVAFSFTSVAEIFVTLSFLLVALLFVYRFAVAYAPVRREIKLSPLHFLVYIMAFEVVPLLLIYKSLILFLVRTT